MLYRASEVPDAHDHKDLYVFTEVPDYLKFNLHQNLEALARKSWKVNDGFLANLSQYNDIDDYLKNHFGKTSRSKIRRYLKRLETCLEPTYKIYFGDIDENEYHRLFDYLKTFMMRRFAQKREENIDLPLLEEYRGLLLPMIRKKRAGIFVIYHGNRPIDIATSVINGNVLGTSIGSYDINYEVFSLGTIDLYKHVEWCFDKGFEILDLGRGDYFYKRKWVDEKYIFHKHLIYDPKNLKHRLTVSLKKAYGQFVYNMINFLKKLKVQYLWGKYFRLHYQYFRKDLHVELHKKFFVLNEVEEPDWSSLESIHLEDAENIWLTKPINDFIYKAHEKFENVQVFAKTGTNGIEYYLRGKGTIQKIVLDNE